jgi:hypothetical protein
MIAKAQLANREKRNGGALAASKGLPHAGVDSMLPPEPAEAVVGARVRPDFARIAVHARTGVRLARQPLPPAAPGWSDAPTHGRNAGESTVDEQGKVVSGKATSKGVWRIPLDGLTHGYQGGDKGPTYESPKGRAIVLIPNTVKPPASEKDQPVTVDVLLHFHGYGVGYRQLRPGQHDYPKVLAEDQTRDVELYQMEQQLLAHVATSQRLLIAVLPQGSEKSAFTGIGADSGAYLTEVFGKLIPGYLPEKAVPGRLIVSGHSGGGVAAMATANQRATTKQRTDVMLFDAINFSSDTCTSNEITTVTTWVSHQITADVDSLTTVPEAQQPGVLQTKGTRFRGVTSGSLASTDACSYGFYYGKLKKHIDTTITALTVSDAVRNQLRQNYTVREVEHLDKYKGMERHERMLGAKNLEEALKD